MAITLPIEDALQTISRSQASGVLSVGESVRAVFVRGSLSHIEDSSAKEVEGICDLLKDAGCLADSVVALVQQANVAVEQLGALLVSKEYLSEDEFERARKAYQKNRLYNVLADEEVLADFAADRTVRSDEHSLNVLATELLLDIVGMREAQEAVLSKALAAEVNVRLAEEYEVSGLTLEEVILVTLLQQSERLNVAEIEQKSLMSRADLFVCLKVLKEKGVVLIGEEEIQTELDEEEEEEILSDLFDDSLEAEDEQNEYEAESFWGENALEEELTEQSTESYDPPAEFEPESNRWAESESDGSKLGLGLRLRMLNYRLTETSAVMHVVLVVTILYLVFLAWLMPNMLRHWFDVLAEFTNLSLNS